MKLIGAKNLNEQVKKWGSNETYGKEVVQGTTDHWRMSVYWRHTEMEVKQMYFVKSFASIVTRFVE